MTIRPLDKSFKVKNRTLVPVNRKKGVAVEINGRKYRIFNPAAVESLRATIKWP